MVVNVHRSASCSTLPRQRSRGPSRTTNTQVTSPARKALAVDMRALAISLRDSPAGASDAGDSLQSSFCTTRQSRGEPGDHSVTPITIMHSGISRTNIHAQFTALAEKINAVLLGLQRQSELDRRRLAQLEWKMEAKIDEGLRESLRESDGREKWAEIKGSVKGLIEETQTLTRRVESLDERLWARTNGSEVGKQRLRELEQQLHALEQQSRLQVVTASETQKRQAAKLCHTEHAINDLALHFSKADEEHRAWQNSIQHHRDIEPRMARMEQQQGHLHAEVRSLQMQLDGLENNHGHNSFESHNPADGATGAQPGLDDSVHAAKRSIAELEKKVSGQIEDLSSSLAKLSVKTDSTFNRLGSLADRLETAHEPAIQTIRTEFIQTRTQDRRELDGEIAALNSRMQGYIDSNDEAVLEMREAVRQCSRSAENTTLTLRSEDDPVIRALNEHERGACDLQRKLNDLQTRFDSSIVAANLTVESEKPLDEGDDVRRRLEWLEEQGALKAATEKAEKQQLSQAHDKICELVEQVSRLMQRTASGESSTATLQQQLQQLHDEIEHTDNSAPARAVVEIEAKFNAASEQMADIIARLSEIEGNLEAAHEMGSSRFGEVSVGSEANARPYNSRQPNNDVDRLHLQEKLEAIADHLEIVDELAERVAAFEKRFDSVSGLDSSPICVQAAANSLDVTPEPNAREVHPEVTRQSSSPSTPSKSDEGD